MSLAASEARALPPTRRGRGLRTSVLVAAIPLAILIWLGVWQLQRLQWKSAMLARIDAAEQTAPVPLGAAAPPLFTRVTVSGTLHGPAILYGADVRDDHMGAQLIETLDRPGSLPLLVMLGWVRTDASRPTPVSGPATLTGYIRLPEPATWLSAPDDAAARRFYSLNPAAISPGAAPFTLVALGPPPSSPDAPIPADTLPRPTNNHLQYALTWFGLAAALVGVFVARVLKKETTGPF